MQVGSHHMVVILMYRLMSEKFVANP